MNVPGLTICQFLLSLEVGGAEVLAARIARRLSERHRFIFFCLGDLGPLGRQLSEDGFSVRSLDKRPGIDWRAARRLASAVGREQIDVIHAHQYAPFFYATLGRVTASSYPVVMTEHGRNHPDLPSRRRAMVNRLLLRRGDRLVAVGEAVRRALIDNEGFPAKRVELIFNGVDLSRFSDARRDRAAVRSELGLDAGDLVLIKVARLNHLKDHMTALRAFERVVRVRPEARLVLVGRGELADEVAGAVRDLGLGSSVRLLGLRSDIPRLVGSADLALLTSISEGIPLTLIEAMGAGLPVVATRVGGVPEVVEEGRTGLLAPAGDDAAVAEHILRLSDDAPLREEMGRAGRERAHTFFSEDRMVEEYDKIYREVARTKLRPGATRVVSESSEEPAECVD